MTDLTKAGTFRLGDRMVTRMGYGAMQLAGPGVFGPPKNRETALAVLREAVAAGVDHIDTSDFYGPHVTNQLIREALYPYPKNLVIVTKVGALRGPDASWNPAQNPAELTCAIHDNLRNLGVDVLDVVNLRVMGDVHAPSEGSIGKQFMTLAELQRQGLIRHLGLSNVTSAQVAEAQAIAEVACVQNHYNLAHRQDDPLIDQLGRLGIAYVPFFPLGGFTRFNRTSCRLWPESFARRRCRWRSPGCWYARRTSCSSPALRHWTICGRILRRLISAYRKVSLPSFGRSAPAEHSSSDAQTRHFQPTATV
jgi:aryl-alcohol dehydrogenase-like predicted oxidoreductase